LQTIRIGAGAGYSGDRIEPAVELAEKGRLNYLVFECLAERTIAIAHAARLADQSAGYDPYLSDRMQAVLPSCMAGKVRIITNMGAANPVGAAAETARIARGLGLRGLKIVAVTGDDVTDAVRAEYGGVPGAIGDRLPTLVSANVYLGAEPIVNALRQGADVVITGRVSDPAMFLAPLVHEFGWAFDDWAKLGKGTIVGHLLECAGQITGGYFADPGYKEVPGLSRLGFPLAEVDEAGDAVITKVKGSGGAVTLATCKEQLLYELHDPSSYLQPDVIADFSVVRLREDGFDRIAVTGGSGRQRPDTLKLQVAYLDGFIGEGQISYAGAGSLERGRLALDCVEERLTRTGAQVTELRSDLIGVDAVRRGVGRGLPNEVRVRVAGRAVNRREAARIGEEVEALYLNGPAGGGGAWKSTREVIGLVSALYPRERIRSTLTFEST
jgi:hypothetical protein